jgi:hypothetical protein
MTFFIFLTYQKGDEKSISQIYPSGEEGYFIRSNFFYLRFAALRGGGGVSALSTLWQKPGIKKGLRVN